MSFCYSLVVYGTNINPIINILNFPFVSREQESFMKKFFSILAVAATVLLASCGGKGAIASIEVTPAISSSTGDLFQNLYAIKNPFTLNAVAENGENYDVEFSTQLYSPSSADIKGIESCEAWLSYKKADGNYDQLKIAVAEEEKANVATLINEGKGQGAAKDIKFKGTVSKADFQEFEKSETKNIAIIASPAR